MNQQIREHFEMEEYWSEDCGFHHRTLAEDIADYYDLRYKDDRIEWHNGYEWKTNGRSFIESEVRDLIDMHPKKPDGYNSGDPRAYIYSGWIYEVMSNLRGILYNEQ